MDVEVRVGFQFGKAPVQGLVAGAGVGGGLIAIRDLTDSGEEFTGLVVLDEHHADRVGEAAAVEHWCRRRGGKLTDHGEQDPFLFHEVRFEIEAELAIGGVEVVQFGVAAAVHRDDLVDE